MSSGENIHNAFMVVYETYKSVDKLMKFCESRAGDEYYLPAKRFLRHSGDTDWTGWIYWSFILLFQRREDGIIMDNSWINAPVYAVEINLDSDTCIEPELIIAKFEYKDLKDWSPGCSPASFDIFYNPIHKVKLFEGKEENEFEKIVPVQGMERKVSDKYWSLRKVTQKVMPLTEVNIENAYNMIFGSIEELAKITD